MKKLFCSTLVFILILCFSVTAFAEGGCKIEATNPTATPGNTAYVDVSITQNSGISGLDLQIEYDENFLELEEAVNGSIFSYFYITSEDYGVNPYHTIWLEPLKPNATSTGHLLTLKFKVKSSAKVGTATTVKLTLGDGGCVKNSPNESVDFFGTTATVKIAKTGDKTSSATGSGSVTVNNQTTQNSTNVENNVTVNNQTSVENNINSQTGSESTDSTEAETASGSEEKTSSSDATMPDALITQSGYNSSLTQQSASQTENTSSEESTGPLSDPWLVVATAAGVVLAGGIITLIILRLKRTKE